MTAIFAVRPGVAYVAAGASASPLMFNFDGWGGFATRRAILSGVQLSEGVNFQLQDTLRSMIYATNFGNLAGDLVISGMGLAGRCEDGAFGQSGFNGIEQYYRQNRMSARASPIAVAIGNVGLACLLVGQRQTIDNPDAGLSGFNLILKILG